MATGVAAIIIRREKQIVAAFREAGAITPDQAITMESIGMHHRIAFRKLKNRGVLRETAPDYYYLDEGRWIAVTKLRRAMAGVAFVVMLIVLAWAVVMSNHVAR